MLEKVPSHKAQARPTLSPIQRLCQQALAFVFTAIGSLPWKLRSATGATLGYCFGLLPSREQKIARLQLARIGGLPASRHQVAKIFASVGRTALESLNLVPILRNRKTLITVENPELLEALKAQAKPAVILSAHLGNWELLGAFGAAEGLPIFTVARPAQIAVLQGILAAQRDQNGLRVLWRNSEVPGSVEVARELKKGGYLAALIDQDTKVRHTWIPFFGQPASTPDGLIYIGFRFDARFLSAFLVREGWFRFRLVMKDLSSLSGCEAVLREYHKDLEQTIRSHPEQWVWFHKRWRTTPDDVRLSSRSYLDYLRSLPPKKENQ